MAGTCIVQFRATDQWGNYLPATRIRLAPETGEPLQGETDERGLSFLQVPPGRYRLQAECRTLGKEIPLKVERDESLPLVLYPREAAHLVLRTTDGDGRPLPSYLILRADTPAFPAFPQQDGRTGAVFTDDRGATSLLLPPGRYRLTATHGCVHEPVEREVRLAPGDRKTLDFALPVRFPVPPGWYSGDDHVHCRQCWPGHHPAHPDFPVAVAARAARANGLDWFTPTDNLDPFSETYLPMGDREAENREGEFVCLVGDEMGGKNDRGTFHYNVIGIRGPVGQGERKRRVGNVLPDVLEQGGTANINHIFLASGSLQEIEDTPDLPNLEVWCCEDDLERTLPVWYGFLNRGRKLYAVGHSDSTTLYYPGDFVGVRRTYAYLGERTLSAPAILSALKSGHSFCTDGPLLFLEVDGRIPGDHVSPGRSVEVEITAFSLTPLMRVSLVAGGRAIRHWPASGHRFHVTERLPTGDAPWMLATVEAEKTVYAPERSFKGFAFTNPVWLGGEEGPDTDFIPGGTG